MTSHELRNHIDRMNRNGGKDSIFPRQIHSNVLVARVWSTSKIVSKGYEGIVFFITNNQGECVAAINDQESDLHWYVVPKHRKKGHLTKALQQAILPYLFRNGRNLQQITIEDERIGKKNYENSKKVATKLGFVSVDQWENVFELKASNFDWSHERLDEQNFSLTRERVAELQKKMEFIHDILLRSRDELYMTYNDDFGADRLIQQLNRFKSDLR